MTPRLEQPAGGDPTSPPAVELIGITKRFGRVVACDRVDLDAAARAGARDPRRERGRQVDPDEGADRARAARRRPDPPRRCAGADRRSRRGGRPRHRHGPPALQPRRGADGVGERRARRRRPLRPAGGAGAGRGDQRAVRVAHRSRPAHLRPARRDAPTGGDHQVPPARSAGAGVRRADVRVDPGGVGLPLLGAAARGRGGGQGGRARQPQAARGAGGDGRDHDHARRPGGRQPADGIERRGLAGQGDGRTRGVAATRAIRLRSRQRRPERQRGRCRRGAQHDPDASDLSTPRCAAAMDGCCSTSSPSTSPAARSSGWPASRATGNGSSATSCRACAPWTPGTSRSTAAGSSPAGLAPWRRPASP